MPRIIGPMVGTTLPKPDLRIDDEKHGAFVKGKAVISEEVTAALREAKKNGDFNGANGADGVSPTVSVSAITGGKRITITDKNGTKTADVMDGQDGTDGFSPSVNVSKSGKVTTITIADKNGSRTATINDGADGSDYVITDEDITAIAEQAAQLVEVPEGGSGTRGPGILQVSTSPTSYTTAAGGQNPAKRMKLSTIMSEASVSEVLPGDAIRHSYYLYPIYYVDDTYAYTKSGTSIRGASGSAGAAGKDGADGTDGYTPVRGVDYWTTADQETIVQQVITALGTPVFGSVDANNNIILSGELADGTYTIKYEDADGNVTDIGTLNHTFVPEPTYTNVLPLAINSDKTPYNGGKGWKADTRLGSTGAESTSSATGIEVTGFISVENGDAVYLKNITLNQTDSPDKCYVWLYNSSFTAIPGRYSRMDQISSANWTKMVNEGTIEVDGSGNITKITIGNNNMFYTDSTQGDITTVAYLRFSAVEINDNSILSINSPSV